MTRETWYSARRKIAHRQEHLKRLLATLESWLSDHVKNLSPDPVTNLPPVSIAALDQSDSTSLQGFRIKSVTGAEVLISLDPLGDHISVSPAVSADTQQVQQIVGLDESNVYNSMLVLHEGANGAVVAADGFLEGVVEKVLT